MNSRTSRAFRELLGNLPPEIQSQTHEAYRLFMANHEHPGLRFKKVHNNLPIYSARINLEYRVVGIIQVDTIIWFWIGKHSEYDKLLARL